MEGCYQEGYDLPDPHYMLWLAIVIAGSGPVVHSLAYPDAHPVSIFALCKKQEGGLGVSQGDDMSPRLWGSSTS